MQFCPLRYAELDAGDVMFFHSNVFHCSAQNHSDRRRWGFLVAYNRADNNPVKKHHHPFYTPLRKVGQSLGVHYIYLYALFIIIIYKITCFSNKSG